jgi:hypothetical protein
MDADREKIVHRYATLDDLAKVKNAVCELQDAVDSITSNTERTASAVERIDTGYKEVRGWLEGATSATGVRTEGILGQFSSIARGQKWISGIITAAAVGACTTAIVAILNLVNNLFHPVTKLLSP